MEKAVIFSFMLISSIGCNANPASNPFIEVEGVETGDNFVSPFMVQHHEVTVGEYQQCVDVEVCKAWKLPNFLGVHDRDLIATSKYDALAFGRIFVHYSRAWNDEFVIPMVEYARNFSLTESEGNILKFPISWISVREARTYCRWLEGNLPSLNQMHAVQDLFEEGGHYSERESYSDMMVVRDKNGICSTYNLPFNDPRVVSGLYSRNVPDGRSDDKVMRICQISPSIVEDLSDTPKHLFGSLSEWVIRNPEEGTYFATGGSWLNGFFAFDGGSNVSSLSDERRAIDIGFRCVRSQ